MTSTDVLNGLTVRIQVAEIAIRCLCATKIRDDKGISAANIKIKVPGLDEGPFAGKGDGHDFHGLFRFVIGVNRQDGRESSSLVEAGRYPNQG